MAEKDIYEKIDRVDTKHDMKHDEIVMKLDAHIGQLSMINTTSAVLSERLRQLKESMEKFPVPEARPCSFFLEHKKEHKENKTLWQKPIVSGIVGAVFASVVLFAKSIWALIVGKL